MDLGGPHPGGGLVGRTIGSLRIDAFIGRGGMGEVYHGWDQKLNLRALCRALRPLEKIWSTAVTLDVTDEPALVREMALAGCTGVFVGFETLTDQNLVEARKRTPRAEDYSRRVRLFHEHGIQVNGSFVVGFDGDRKDTFTTLAQWIEANRLECATFHILTPYPGTPLFRQLEAEGRLLHRDWEKYDTAHVVFQPEHLTPVELLLGYDWLYRRLFSHASIWRRRPAAFSALRRTLQVVISINARTVYGVF